MKKPDLVTYFKDNIFLSVPSTSAIEWPMWYHGFMEPMEDLEMICLVYCDDCDPTIIHDASYVSMFIDPGNEITVIALCIYCERPVSDQIEFSFALELAEKEVKIFSWLTGEISSNDLRNLINNAGTKKG